VLARVYLSNVKRDHGSSRSPTNPKLQQLDYSFGTLFLQLLLGGVFVPVR
jgi:hypothetical protein